MSTIHDSYVGIKDEVTYATGVAVDRFYELVEEGIEGKYERIESEALRAGQKTMRSDRFTPNAKGAEGDLKLEVLDTGFGLWFKHMLGGMATTGAGPYVHTATEGAIDGKSFTLQMGRVDSSGTLRPFTYAGGKVAGWELSAEVDGILGLNLSLDFATENITTAGINATHTPSYTAASMAYTFINGAVTIGAVQFDVSAATVGCDNKLKTDRYFMKGATSTVKKAPLEEGLREYSFKLTGEYDSLTQYNRVVSATRAGALAEIVLTFASETANNSLVITCPAARFDTGPINFGGAEIIEHELSGMCLTTGSSSPVTIAYTSVLDATP